MNRYEWNPKQKYFGLVFVPCLSFLSALIKFMNNTKHEFSLRLFLYSVDPNDQKKTACYDIDVEVEDPLKAQMSSFLLSTANQQEIASLDSKVSAKMEQKIELLDILLWIIWSLISTDSGKIIRI